MPKGKGGPMADGRRSIDDAAGKGATSEPALLHLVEKGGDAADVAETIVSTWQKIDAALHPIIGKGGVAALYKQSLYLAGARRPFFAEMHQRSATELDLAALKSVLEQQSGEGAAASGQALLQTFHELLTRMVGSSLTERLLRPVHEGLRGPSAQDISR
ncbi:MAG: hypothetical protein ABI809_01165 [Caldimonas sp.]